MKNYILNKDEILHLPKNAKHPVIREFLQNFTKGVSWKTAFDAEDNTRKIWAIFLTSSIMNLFLWVEAKRLGKQCFVKIQSTF